MANIYEPSPDEIAEFDERVESLPEPVKSIAKRFNPWQLYIMKSTSHRVTVISISAVGTLTVNVSGEHNSLMFERQVFGVSPDDLEECDLPTSNEVTGALMSAERAEENIDALRVAVRPDLWQMDENGNAVRRINHPAKD